MATQTTRHAVISAVHLFLTRGNEVLLLRRFNTGYEDGKYSVVAGHIEAGEEVRHAAVREAWEEAGISIRAKDLTVVGVMHRKSEEDRVDFFLTAHVWQGEIQNMEPNKCDDLRWFDLPHLPDNIVPYVKTALDKGFRQMWYTAYGWD